MIGVEAILETDHRRTRGVRKGRRRTVGKGPNAVVDRRFGIVLVHALGQDSAGIASADCEKSIEYSTIPRELRGTSLMSLDNCVERVLRSDLTRCRPVELLVFADIAAKCRRRLRSDYDARNPRLRSRRRAE